MDECMKIRKKNKLKNYLGYKKPRNVHCGLFMVCEWAGSDKEGGRCSYCDKNYNVDLTGGYKPFG